VRKRKAAKPTARAAIPAVSPELKVAVRAVQEKILANFRMAQKSVAPQAAIEWDGTKTALALWIRDEYNARRIPEATSLTNAYDIIGPRYSVNGKPANGHSLRNLADQYDARQS